MAEYHVGCGLFGIYAGTLEPRNKSLWRNKSDVIIEVLSASAQYLLEQAKEFRFNFHGKRYVMLVDELKEGE